MTHEKMIIRLQEVAKSQQSVARVGSVVGRTLAFGSFGEGRRQIMNDYEALPQASVWARREEDSLHGLGCCIMWFI